MPILETDRGDFFYEEYASAGPPVYLFHGLTAKHQDWGSVPDVLGKTGFHVFSFDMRGHGRSCKPKEGYSPEDHGRDIGACAGALGHGKVHLVGHSTGGRNVLMAAVLFPGLAASLTVIDQTLRADPESWKKYQARYREFPAPFPDEQKLDKFLSKMFPGDEKRQVYYKGQFWRDDQGRWDWNYSTEAAWKTQQLGRAADAHGLLEKVACPMLFMKGGDSRYVPEEEGELIRRLMPRGKWAVVPQAEHAIFRDNPEGFLKVLVPFLLEQSS